jgi:hypothetical protein
MPGQIGIAVDGDVVSLSAGQGKPAGQDEQQRAEAASPFR